MDIAPNWAAKWYDFLLPNSRKYLLKGLRFRPIQTCNHEQKELEWWISSIHSNHSISGALKTSDTIWGLASAKWHHLLLSSVEFSRTIKASAQVSRCLGDWRTGHHDVQSSPKATTATRLFLKGAKRPQPVISSGFPAFMTLSSLWMSNILVPNCRKSFQKLY